jgi:hypothetical protein
MKKIMILAVLLSGCASVPVKKIGEIETTTVYKADGCTVFVIKQPAEPGHETPPLNYFFSCPQK